MENESLPSQTTEKEKDEEEEEKTKVEATESTPENVFEKLAQAMWMRFVTDVGLFLEHTKKTQEDQIKFYIETNKHQFEELKRVQTSLFEALAKDDAEFKMHVESKIREAVAMQGYGIAEGFAKLESVMVERLEKIDAKLHTDHAIERVTAGLNQLDLMQLEIDSSIVGFQEMTEGVIKKLEVLEQSVRDEKDATCDCLVGMKKSFLKRFDEIELNLDRRHAQLALSIRQVDQPYPLHTRP